MTVVLSAHPDDAALSCWHLLGAGSEISVFTLFAADPADRLQPGSWDRLTRGLDPRSRAAERRLEDHAALDGVADVRHFGFLDAQYRSEPPRADSVAQAILEALPEPGRTIVYAPVAIGEHADHLLAREAALALSGHVEAIRFYADLPYAARYGWPEWIDASPRNDWLDPEQAWEASLRLLTEIPWDVERRVHVLDERDQAAKLKALREYRSQFEALNNGPLRRLEQPWFLSYEVTWE